MDSSTEIEVRTEQNSDSVTERAKRFLQRRESAVPFLLTSTAAQWSTLFLGISGAESLAQGDISQSLLKAAAAVGAYNVSEVPRKVYYKLKGEPDPGIFSLKKILRRSKS